MKRVIWATGILAMILLSVLVGGCIYFFDKLKLEKGRKMTAAATKARWSKDQEKEQEPNEDPKHEEVNNQVIESTTLK